MASVLLAACIVALIFVRRARTGEWQVPNRDDVKAVRSGANRVVEKVADRVLDRKPQASKTIFLDGTGPELVAGTDDAGNGVSSVIASGSKATVKVPKWSGSKRNWKKLVKCVQEQFSPFDVVVTDERPTENDFMLAVVGGRAKDIGVKSGHVGGLAPFNSKVIPRAVVFAFSRTLRNRVQTVCETLAMEIAHAYGLDHAYHCPDAMTYLRGCGKKRFRDKTVPCGEKKKRACADGNPTQNSVQRLTAVLGPSRKKP